MSISRYLSAIGSTPQQNAVASDSAKPRRQFPVVACMRRVLRRAAKNTGTCATFTRVLWGCRLPEARSIGIVVAEEPGSDTAISRRSGTVTAFVGRTLRGPIDRPVAVHSYAEFHQIFGGLWQPSTLAYTIEQFFENG